MFEYHTFEFVVRKDQSFVENMTRLMKEPWASGFKREWLEDSIRMYLFKVEWHGGDSLAVRFRRPILPTECVNNPCVNHPPEKPCYCLGYRSPPLTAHACKNPGYGCPVCLPYAGKFYSGYDAAKPGGDRTVVTTVVPQLNMHIDSAFIRSDGALSIMLEEVEKAATRNALRRERELETMLGFTPTIKPMNILDKAKDTVDSNRQSEYGDPVENWVATALIATITQRKPITPEDVIQVMTAQKSVRAGRSHKEDTNIDQAGYAEIRERVQKAWKDGTVQKIVEKLLGSWVKFDTQVTKPTPNAHLDRIEYLGEVKRVSFIMHDLSEVHKGHLRQPDFGSDYIIIKK